MFASDQCAGPTTCLYQDGPFLMHMYKKRIFITTTSKKFSKTSFYVSKYTPCSRSSNFLLIFQVLGSTGSYIMGHKKTKMWVMLQLLEDLIQLDRYNRTKKKETKQ